MTRLLSRLQVTLGLAVICFCVPLPRAAAAATITPIDSSGCAIASLNGVSDLDGRCTGFEPGVPPVDAMAQVTDGTNMATADHLSGIVGLTISLSGNVSAQIDSTVTSLTASSGRGITFSISESLPYTFSGEVTGSGFFQLFEANGFALLTDTLPPTDIFRQDGNGSLSMSGVLAPGTYKFGANVSAECNTDAASLCSAGTASYSYTATLVLPEPTTALLLITGLAGLAARRRRLH